VVGSIEMQGAQLLEKNLGNSISGRVVLKKQFDSRSTIRWEPCPVGVSIEQGANGLLELLHRCLT